MSNKNYFHYGNIEKTVKMPVPPTWEEFMKMPRFCRSFYIESSNGESIVLDYYNDKHSETTERLRLVPDSFEWHWNLPNTKENYYKCLDKMVELWMEEVEEKSREKLKGGKTNE